MAKPIKPARYMRNARKRARELEEVTNTPSLAETVREIANKINASRDVIDAEYEETPNVG